MPKSSKNRDREISQFIPDSALPPCKLCQTFPVALDKEALVSRLDRRIAKLTPGRRREKLERLRVELGRSKALTLYLHGERELFTFPMLKAAIPGVTVSNWTSVRDYVFYGPQIAPTPGPGSLYYSIACRFCSPKDIHSILLPAIADLRLEHSEAVREGRFGGGLRIHVHASWDFVRILALCAWRKALRSDS